MDGDERKTDLQSACGEVAALLPGLVVGDLSDGDAGRLRAHLANCPGCRARAMAIDPTVMFLSLGSEAIPDSFWTSFDARLRERLAAESSGGLFNVRRWVRTWSRLPKVAWLAPAAMAVLLGVSLYVALPGTGWRTRPSRPADLLQDPYRDAARRPPAGTAPGADRQPTGPPPLAAGRPGPEMEDVASPGARVYRFEVGGSGDETPVYLVVDESIDI